MAFISLDRERLKFAKECVLRVRDDLNIDDVADNGERSGGVEAWRSYRRRVRGLGADLREHGIGHVAAVLQAKEHFLFGHVQGWLFHEYSPVPWASAENDLVERLREDPPEVWWVAAREAQAFAGWLKLLVDAYPKD